MQGITVFTGLKSAIPIVDEKSIHWLWEESAIECVTLNRFNSLHHFYPFLIADANMAHITPLHLYDFEPFCT